MQLKYTSICERCDNVVSNGARCIPHSKPGKVICIQCTRPDELPAVSSLAAGASALKKHDQLLAAYRRKQEIKWGPFAGVVKFCTGTPRYIAVWKQGSKGEAIVGRALDAISGVTGLHDRKWPTKDVANIDHIAVTPTGIGIIDAKNYRGNKIEGNPRSSYAQARAQRSVERQNRRQIDKACFGVARQMIDVRNALAVSGVADVPIFGIVCMTGKLNRWRWPYQVNGVWVCRPRHLKRILRKGKRISWDHDTLTRIVAQVLPSHG